MMLREYVMTYSLTNTKDPLFPVTFNKSEDHLTDSLLERAITAFAENGIGDRWKISLTEFMELPVYICDMLLEASSELNRKEEARLTQMNKTLGRTLPTQKRR